MSVNAMNGKCIGSGQPQGYSFVEMASGSGNSAILCLSSSDTRIEAYLA